MVSGNGSASMRHYLGEGPNGYMASRGPSNVGAALLPPSFSYPPPFLVIGGPPPSCLKTYDKKCLKRRMLEQWDPNYKLRKLRQEHDRAVEEAKKLESEQEGYARVLEARQAVTFEREKTLFEEKINPDAKQEQETNDKGNRLPLYLSNNFNSKGISICAIPTQDGDRVPSKRNYPGKSKTRGYPTQGDGGFGNTHLEDGNDAPRLKVQKRFRLGSVDGELQEPKPTMLQGPPQRPQGRRFPKLLSFEGNTPIPSSSAPPRPKDPGPRLQTNQGVGRGVGAASKGRPGIQIAGSSSNVQGAKTPPFSLSDVDAKLEAAIDGEEKEVWDYDRTKDFEIRRTQALGANKYDVRMNLRGKSKLLEWLHWIQTLTDKVRIFALRTTSTVLLLDPRTLSADPGERKDAILSMSNEKLRLVEALMLRCLSRDGYANWRDIHEEHEMMKGVQSA
eukprot:Plantae.Rhodophyta-Hildenbrandia_rubra.ctg17711.p1 GENE.Plantae.Rhodophyta-Hildenbrandia_rubra.ctg17711~~Plantae.Rhodophyta-Hildenbrandia_rubra.ctg17711.p1  ORF type:complete len:447 (+),score=69.13 Plantae.Rhodophyta-Hildenbrandia_rubra.ctg17711:508-1848(+)